jgi:mannose-6-phosphate isomerase-like protein (cupin superfamily)
LRIDAGAGSPAFRREEAEVVFVHLGRTRVNWSGGSLSLSVGDTLTIPPGVDRSFVNDAAQAAVLYIVRGGDHPHAAQPVDSRSLMS